MKIRTGFSALALVCVLGLASMTSAAVLNSTGGGQLVTLTATASESLTVNLSGASVTWPAIDPGSSSTDVNNQAGAVSVTTAWRLASGRTAVKVYSYFNSATAAMTGATSGTLIPSSAVMIKGGDLGGTFTAVSGSDSIPGGVAGATLLMKTITPTPTTRNSSDTTIYNFALDLSGGTLPQLPSEIYTGNLYIEAQATP